MAAPGHFRRYGFPQTPADLVAHPCIAYQFADGSDYQWELVEDGKKSSIKGQWALSDSYMEAEAARLGLGLAYVP